MNALHTLEIGDAVSIRGHAGDGEQFQALDIDLDPHFTEEKWQGRLEWVDVQSATAGLLGHTLDLSSVKKLQNESRRPITLADLKPGMVVKAKGGFVDGRFRTVKARSAHMTDFLFDEVQARIQDIDLDRRLVKVPGFTAIVADDTAVLRLDPAVRQSLPLDDRRLCPVVVGCAGGSGSRALRDVLAACPQIFMDRDCNSLMRDSRKPKKWLKTSGADLAGILRGFMGSILEQIPATDVTRYTHFGWKLPESIHHVDTHLKSHPRLRFIHLIRDPAAMAGGRQWKKFAKLAVVGEPGRRHAPRVEWILRRWAEINLSNWEKHRDDPRYYLVRYEDLISKPRPTITGLFDWLGVGSSGLEKAIAVIRPPRDAVSRGDSVDISAIAEAAAALGYGSRPAPRTSPSPDYRSI